MSLKCIYSNWIKNWGSLSFPWKNRQPLLGLVWSWACYSISTHQWCWIAVIPLSCFVENLHIKSSLHSQYKHHFVMIFFKHWHSSPLLIRINMHLTTDERQHYFLIHESIKFSSAHVSSLSKQWVLTENSLKDSYLSLFSVPASLSSKAP